MSDYDVEVTVGDNGDFREAMQTALTNELSAQATEAQTTYLAELVKGVVSESTHIDEAKNLIPQFQKIVDDKQAAKISGVFVDMQTANTIVKIYGKVGADTKKKMESLGVDNLVAGALMAMGGAS